MNWKLCTANILCDLITQTGIIKCLIVHSYPIAIFLTFNLGLCYSVTIKNIKYRTLWNNNFTNFHITVFKPIQWSFGFSSHWPWKKVKYIPITPIETYLKIDNIFDKLCRRPTPPPPIIFISSDLKQTQQSIPAMCLIFLLKKNI